MLTTALNEEAKMLAWLSDQLAGHHRELAALDRVVGDGILTAADAPRSALLAESDIDEALRLPTSAVEDCRRLATGVDSAASGYEFAERFADRLGQELAAGLGYLVGSIAPFLLALVLPGAVVGAAALLAGAAMLPSSSRARAVANLQQWFRQNAAPLSDPRFVETVRMTVMSADDAGWGMLHVPPELASVLGDDGLGLFGVDTSAAVVGGLAAGVGVLRETPVRVSAGNSVAGVAQAQGIQDRVARIPDESDQVRIDRYTTPGLPDRFEVYIAGTAELAVAGDAEPWDMTSNVTAMAGASAGSLRAVEEAMRLAGIDSTSAVTLTGYSQGGLIAAQLAASGHYSVDGLLTVGAPAGQVSVPHDIPYLAIEHTNDLVPALGGTFESSEPVIVRRQLFDGPPPPSEFVLPAHQLSNYVDTARLVDTSSNSTIEATLSRFNHAGFEDVTSTMYHAERVGR